MFDPVAEDSKKSVRHEFRIPENLRIGCSGLQKMIASRAGNFKKSAGGELRILRKDRHHTHLKMSDPQIFNRFSGEDLLECMSVQQKHPATMRRICRKA